MRKTHEHWSAGQNQSLNQLFSLNFLLRYWYFTNLPMSIESEFGFIKTTIIIFCLIFSLRISYSKQIPNFFLLKAQDLSLVNWHFGDMLPYFSDPSHTNAILKFLFVWFSYCLVLMTNTKHIVYLSFPGPQPKLNWVSKFY